MTYKTGSIGEFTQWTKQVVTDCSALFSVPRQWFDSEETARPVAPNARKLLGRADGISAPRLLARRITLDLNLVGAKSAVPADGAAPV